MRRGRKGIHMAKRFGSGKAAHGKHAATGKAVPAAALLGADANASGNGPASMSEPAPEKGPKRRRKLGLIALGIVVGVLLAVYLAGFATFSFIFYPNTTLEGADVSLKPASEVSASAASALDGFEAQVTGDGFSTTIKGSDVDLAFDEGAYARSLIEQQRAWAWPVLVARTHELESAGGAAYDADKLESTLGSAIDAFNEGAEQPVDATIGFDEASQAYAVVPEQLGTALDKDATVTYVGEQLKSLTEKVKLGQDCLARPQVTSEEPALAEAAKNANRFMTADIPLTMGGAAAGEVTRTQIATWITLDENHNATLDDAKLADWVKTEVAAKYDTRGAARTYTRPDGKQVTVPATGDSHWGDAYGWVTDEAALTEALKTAVEAGSTDAIEIPTKETAQVVPDAGLKDWGNRYIDIDLSEQHVRLYDDSGAVVWESDCVTGDHAKGHDTPTGVYVLNGNRASGDVELKGAIDPATNQPEYVSHVSYWMPFIGNSWALHDATWRSSFGGSIYQYNGSHGCVNLPSDKAKELFGLCKVGDVVVVHN